MQWSRPLDELSAWTAALATRYAAMPKSALAANKRCIAAATDCARDGYAEEISETRTLYDHPDTRRRVTAFLERDAARSAGAGKPTNPNPLQPTKEPS